MLKKYISKFTIDILPSVLATIIGAYIVNHYIVTKPDAPAAALASTPESAKAPAEPAADVVGVAGAGVKAKGVSEKALLEKTASERPAVADRPTETASLPADSRRAQPAPKPIAKAATSPAPTVSAAPAEAPAAAEEKRDAADLARAAIARLRAAPEAQAHVQDAPHSPETPRLSEVPVTATPASVPPLPPAVTVATPVNQNTASVPSRQPYGLEPSEDSGRLTPPADIPTFSRPLDLRTEVAESAPRQRTSVAEDVLSAAKSVFHAVLPR
jgi:hypothetical protein